MRIYDGNLAGLLIQNTEKTRWTMQQKIMELAAAFFGPLGLGILFHLRGSLLLPAAFGGWMNRVIFLLAQEAIGGRMIPCLLSSAVTAAYAECLARLLKTPATILLLPAIATSAPGRMLFFAIRSMVEGKKAMAWSYGIITAQSALAVAMGISLVWACFMTAGKMREER